MTIEAARQGFAFAAVRPRADRNYQARTVNLIFTIEEGQRVYIEQINIRGNTRTRDYVIRREFDVSEGDPYNRALITRAERRLKNLNYFKDVKITTEPGSAPDRVVINVDRRRTCRPASSRSPAATRPPTASWARSASASATCSAAASTPRRRSNTASMRSGCSCRSSSRICSATGWRWGLDLFADARRWRPISSPTRPGRLAAPCGFGFALREDLSLQLRYSLYSQKVDAAVTRCRTVTTSIRTLSTPSRRQPHRIRRRRYTGLINPGATQTDCFADGEASLAVRRELAQGSVLTSLVGYDLSYNTLDNNRNPTSGMLAVLKQDFAGVGGDVQYVRTTADVRSYYEVIPDVVGVLHLQGGHIFGWGARTR